MNTCTLCGGTDVHAYVHRGVAAPAVVVVHCRHCDRVCPARFNGAECAQCDAADRNKRN